MPHKRNPVLTENITGIARVIRSSVIPSLENISLWHERDISHSSVERMIFPDSLILTDFAIHRMKGVIKNLVVNKAEMKQNLDKTNGLFNSQRVMLKLIEKGISRENSYDIVQKLAMNSWKKKIDFKKLLKKNKDLKKFLTVKEIDDIFDINYHLKNIDKIFKKVLGQ